MAERSVRTGDEEDQARFLRSLDDRIAALERETIVIPNPDPVEPCCCPVGAVEVYNQTAGEIGLEDATGVYPWDGTTRSCGASLDCATFEIVFEVEALWHVTASVPVFTTNSPCTAGMMIYESVLGYAIAQDALVISADGESTQQFLHASRDWHFRQGDRLGLRPHALGGPISFLQGGYLSAHLVDCSCVEDVEWGSTCSGAMIITPPICVAPG